MAHASSSSSSSSSTTTIHIRCGRRQSHFGAAGVIWLLLLVATTTPQWCDGFVTAPGHSSSPLLLRRKYNSHSTKLFMAGKTMEPEEIKRQLMEYLTIRLEQNADDKARA
jgi:hypothetical protein